MKCRSEINGQKKPGGRPTRTPHAQAYQLEEETEEDCYNIFRLGIPKVDPYTVDEELHAVQATLEIDTE